APPPAPRAGRLAPARPAATSLNTSAELAPVLGLAGTLISLAGLSTAVAEQGDYARAIGMAVATTLYGLVAANFVFAPLAAIAARRAEAEDRAREEIIDWLSAARSEEHTSELQSREKLVCRLLLEQKTGH